MYNFDVAGYYNNQKADSRHLSVLSRRLSAEAEKRTAGTYAPGIRTPGIRAPGIHAPGKRAPGKRVAGERSRAVPQPGTRPEAIDRNSKLYEVCQDFESIFIKQMLNVMRKTVHKTGLVDGGMAEEVFEDMLYDKYALKMAKNAGFGLSDVLYRELNLENFG